MCKPCLNTRLNFDVIMSHTKPYGGQEYLSISDFLMTNCKCVKDANRYYGLNCCLGYCSECKDDIPPKIPNLDTGIKVNYFLYETTKTPYVDKNGVQKISNKTERVPDQNVDIKDVVQKFLESSKVYLLIYKKSILRSLSIFSIQYPPSDPSFILIILKTSS